MSVDRCTIAKQIIQSCFTGDTERVTGDDPERDGIYTVTALAGSYDRADQLRVKVSAALRNEGFECTARRQGSLNAHGVITMSFRVQVGDARSL